MDSRHAPHTQRPPPPQRAVSGHHRPPLPSRLSNVRSVSQPFNAVNTAPDASRSADVRNSAAFLSSRETVYTSPDVIDLEDDENERPPKRIKTEGNTLRTRDNTTEHGNDSARQTVPGSPLPPIRKQATSSTVKSGSLKVRPTAVSRAARKANGLEPPPMATRLPAPRNVADFSPWSGHHPEDQMSETVIKAGYFDKPPGPNSTESNSAKPAIWPNLSQKNNMGLQTLSYLFTSVMEKRQAMGRCIAPSTFKPPPRVTVTDTKREAWLRDLSNPDVPLRKQSRTIPHGIRGKLLMEQCLGKDIPMPRAVWLAKCVGANELRAFRRKGVSGAAAASGEQKWVREWTIAVEQFLEGVIATCGQADWQPRMGYAVKLATSFYSERLLERDHYLDWIVASFTQATIDKLPIWVILIQLYWRDTTAFGRRGRLLAEAILETLDKINAGSMRVNDSLRDRLRKLVMVMAVTNRGCLVLPRTWDKYRYILAPRTLPFVHASVESPAHNIAKRNHRLAGPLNKTPQNTRCALLDMYTVLDDVGLHVDPEELLSICTKKVPDVSNLVSALLKWSASVFRTGMSRIYLAARLIALLAKRGDDVDGTVLDFLKTANSSQLSVENVHRAVGELVRMKCFSTGRYLQWLMVSGMLSEGGHSGLATGLLAALPGHTLPVHLINTRRMLLQRLGSTTDDTSKAQQLAEDTEAAISSSSQVDLDAIADMSTSAKLEFAHQLSLFAKQRCLDQSITLHQFEVYRDALGRASDVPVFANVVEAAMETQSSLLLATVSDSISMHARSLAAIGRLRSLVDALLERYNVLRQQSLDRTCILSATSLVKRFPDMANESRLLENDLAICESQGMMAVCSPASDSLVSMQASNLDSDEDIDRVFDSGNTMDEQLMQRLFARVVQRADKPPTSQQQVPSKICQWLNRLRSLDPAGFDELVKNYLVGCFKDPGDGLASCQIVSTLIGSLCTSITLVVEAAKKAGKPSASSMMMRLLTSDHAVACSLHASERFRFALLRCLYVSDHAADVFQLLTTALEDAKLEVEDRGLVSFVSEKLATHTAQALEVLCTGHQRSSAVQNCDLLAKRVLGHHGAHDINNLVAQADALSIVHHGAALSFYSRNCTPESNNMSADVLQEAVLGAIKDGSEVWPQLLEAAGTGSISSIYQWARDRVLSSVLQRDGTSLQVEEIIRHLDILDVAFHAWKGDDGSAVLAAITERLRALEQTLSAVDFDASRGDRKLSCCMHVMLHLSTLYGTPALDADSDAVRQTRVPLLATLCSLLANQKLQSQQPLLEYIHDVASAVSDTIPSELLATMTKSHDPRLAYILGSTPSPDGWLALVTNPQPQGTQQQRALMKQHAGRQSPILQQAPQAGAMRVPFPLRRWEVMPDATPTVAENDTSLSLGLFGARRV